MVAAAGAAAGAAVVVEGRSRTKKERV